MRSSVLCKSEKKKQILFFSSSKNGFSVIHDKNVSPIYCNFGYFFFLTGLYLRDMRESHYPVLYAKRESVKTSGQNPRDTKRKRSY